MTIQAAIQFEDVSKRYRLGEIGTGTLSHDLARFWAKVRGREDPFAEVGAVNDREIAGDEYVWALRNVNFEVNEGQVLGIIGRNGAGKSTLLKTLSRITLPTTGEIRMSGRIASLLEVGTGFHPELTGRENIYLNGAILGMSRREITKRLDSIVEFSGCAKYVDTPVKRFSSGMLVRLGFSVAAHLECEVLVVDEVLAVGDAEFQNRCMGKLQELSSNRGRTVLFVSHNLSSIQRLCTEAIVLDRGTVTFEGTPRDAIDFYSSRFEAFADNDLSRSEQYGPQVYGRLERCEITDSDGLPSNLFRMGDSLRIRLTYHCTRSLCPIEVGVKLSTITGTPIHYFPSSWEGQSFEADPGYHQFEVIVPKLSVLPGKYLIGAWTLKPGDKSDHNVPGITAIEVISADVNGHQPDFARYATGVGESYAESRWSHERS